MTYLPVESLERLLIDVIHECKYDLQYLTVESLERLERLLNVVHECQYELLT